MSIVNSVPDADQRAVLRFPFERPDVLQQSSELVRLRQVCPLAHVEVPSGARMVLVTGYDDVQAVLTSPSASLAAAARPGAPTFLPFTALCEGLLSLDAPQHSAARRMLTQCLTTGRVAAQQHHIERLAHQCVRDLLASGAPADFVSTVAEPVSVGAMAALLDVEADQLDDLRRRFGTLIAIDGTGAEDPVPAWRALEAAVLGHLDSHSGAGDDLLSAMVRHQRDPANSVTVAQLVGVVVTLIGAGIGTPIIELAHGVAVLLRHPRQWQDLCAHPWLVRNAVEEILRFCTPVEVDHVRVLTGSLELAWTSLAGGTAVLPSIAAANRDAVRFPAPDRFDIRREPNGHLGFGRGPHACAGSAVARNQLRTVLRTLCEDAPSLRLLDSDEPLRLRSRESHSLSLAQLLVCW
jgi:cytochrome P450